MVESDDDDDNMGSAANDVPGLRRAGDENGGDGGGGGDDYDDDTAVAPDSEEEGEDLIENAHQDYQAIEELDRYDESMLDARQSHALEEVRQTVLPMLLAWRASGPRRVPE